LAPTGALSDATPFDPINHCRGHATGPARRLTCGGLPAAAAEEPAMHFLNLLLRRTIGAALPAMAGALLSVPAHAGRPLATDDAAIVDPGACQLELWLERDRGSRALWANPGCNPFGATEFALGGARVRQGDAGAVTVTAWQVKHLLRAFDERTAGFALALRNERDRRVHAGLPPLQGDTELKGIATWPLAGEALLLHANAGALRQRESGDEPLRRTRATWAVALDAEILPATRASLESFGVGSERLRWQAGLRHALRDGLQLDFAFGAQAGRFSDTRQVNVGLVFVSPVLR
jgi:hypothetical protein